MIFKVLDKNFKEIEEVINDFLSKYTYPVRMLVRVICKISASYCSFWPYH